MTALYQQDFLEINGLFLELTCQACPEQYDVYGEMVENRAGGDRPERLGYLRLRHGSFTAEGPFGNEVYRARPEGDGIFEDEERGRFLGEAMNALRAHLDEVGMLPKDAWE